MAILSTRCVLPALILSFGIASGSAQAGGLNLDSASALAGATVSLNLNLTSQAGNPAAAVQWTLVFDATKISAIQSAAGSAATI